MILEADNIIVPIIQMRKLRHRAVKSYPGATAGKWQAWSLNESVVLGFEVRPQRHLGALWEAGVGVTSNPFDLICLIDFSLRNKDFWNKRVKPSNNFIDRWQEPLSEEAGDLPSLL